MEHGRDRVTGAQFYRAIGGAREPGEMATEAVIREWQEEFALTVHVVRALGTLDNQFVHEGAAGHEHVSVFEVRPHDATVFAAQRLDGRDPDGLQHTATWVNPAALELGVRPLYPAGVLDLLRAAG